MNPRAILFMTLNPMYSCIVNKSEDRNIFSEMLCNPRRIITSSGILNPILFLSIFKQS